VVTNRSGKENIHVFLRPESLAVADCGGVKAHDELASARPDGRLASHKSPDIRAKENNQI
jgi:hypothetical protein